MRLYVAEGSGLDSKNVIPGNEKFPAPNELYASVLLLSSSQVGSKETLRKYDGITNRGKTYGYFRTIYSVQWYYKGAIAAASRFRNYCGSDMGLLNAERFNIAITNYSDIRRIDVLEDADLEERTNIDLTVDHVGRIDQDIGVIREVDVDFNRFKEFSIKINN